MNKNAVLKRILKHLLALCLTLCTGWMFAPLEAANRFWTGGVGDWSDTTWTGGVVPDDTDSAYISNNGTISVTTDDAEANYLYLGSGGTLNNKIIIKDGGYLTNTTAGLVGVDINSAGFLTIESGGTWKTMGNTTIGRLGNGTLTIEEGGLLLTGANALLGDPQLDTHTSEGTATVAGTWTITGYLSVGHYSKGTVNIDGGSVTSNGNSYIGNNKTVVEDEVVRFGEGAVNIAHGGSWTNTGNLTLGLQGLGALRIGAGSQASITESVTVGGGTETVNGDGSIEVDGVNAKLIIDKALNLGDWGRGTLDVKNGALVQVAGQIQAGRNNGSYGHIVVTGVGSSISLTGSGANGRITLQQGDSSLLVGTGGSVSHNENLNIGNGVNGAATLTIQSGGSITTGGSVYLANQHESAEGTATVAGTWNITSGLYVAHNGEGTFTISSGGVVTTSGTTYIGQNATAYGVLNVNGTLHTTNVTVGSNGEGVLTVSGGAGTLNVGSGTGTVTLANAATAKGALNIGAAVGGPAVAAGRVNAATVTSSVSAPDGSAKLNFNHTDSNYSFQRTNGDNINITNKVQVNAYSGVTKLEKADGYTYSGGTSIYGGTLLVNNTSNSGTGTGEVIVHSGGTFGGSGLITGALTLEGGGNLSPGATQNSVGNLRAANFTWDGGGKMVFSLGSTEDLVDSDRLTLSGSFVKSGTGSWIFAFSDASLSEGPQIGNTYTLVTFNSYSGFSESDFGFSYAGSLGGMEGSFALHSGDLQFTVTGIPEPGILSLLVAGGIGALLYTRRRRKQSVKNAFTH